MGRSRVLQAPGEVPEQHRPCSSAPGLHAVLCHGIAGVPGSPRHSSRPEVQDHAALPRAASPAASTQPPLAPFSWVSLASRWATLLVPSANLGNSNTPRGPFHRMVLASLSAAAICSEASGPTSRPCRRRCRAKGRVEDGTARRAFMCGPGIVRGRCACHAGPSNPHGSTPSRPGVQSRPTHPNPPRQPCGPGSIRIAPSSPRGSCQWGRSWSRRPAQTCPPQRRPWAG